MLTDTIVAPATTLSKQAISIIRVSGPDAFLIVNKLLIKPLKEKVGIYYKKIYDDKQLLDEVVILKFKAPKSFTGENTIEINCHGGVFITNKIIQTLIKNGARLAFPGEFSQQAYINGKLNLIQADGINSLINANNEFSARLALKNMDSNNNKQIMKLKENLLEIISKIQVSIDYPDYDDIEHSTHEDLKIAIEKLLKTLNETIQSSELANKSINGVTTALIGKTNVGKSSLLNALTNENKAIVSDIPGTTRDYVEGDIKLKNINLKIFDTAGLRSSNDEIEKIGVKKSLEIIKKVDLILLVFDAQNFNKSDIDELTNNVKNGKYIIVFNKIDLLTQEQKNNLQKTYPEAVLISAKQNNITELITKIEALFINESILKKDIAILADNNQIALLKKIKQALTIALKNINEGYPIDILLLDLNSAWDDLNNLIGEAVEEEIINNIFRKYCLGK